MEKQNRTLLVLKYLWDNTDIDHPATIKDIAAYLEGFGYNATRKTISKDIDELIEIGIDIDCKREEHNLYFLDVRVFELAEVKLLVDAVQSSRFIPTKKSKALIEKLSTFVGPHQSNILKRQLYVDKRVKASNEGIFYLVGDKQPIAPETPKELVDIDTELDIPSLEEIDNADDKDLGNFNAKTFLKQAVKTGASDIHLHVGERPVLRKDGKMVKIDMDFLDDEDMERTIMTL